ncbi:MAG: hypothetical protein ABIR91_05845, partial [Candidatus Saccharimonadales bacterium]
YDDPNDDIIGINHDIDAIAISPRYINRIQRYYRNQKRHYNRNGLAKAPLSPSSTVITHALSTDHPNISKAVQWADFTTRQLDAAYEAGLVFPLSHYAHAGGFQASDQTYETGTLCRNTALPRIPSTTMQTSPRRYIDRIQHGYAKMWSSETFGPNDDCRTSTTRPDITQKQLEDTISADDQIKAVLAAVSSRAIQNHINRMTARHRSPVASEPGQQESIDDIIRQLDAIGTQRRARGQAGEIFDKKARLFTAVLGRVIQSPTLATQVEALQIDKKFRRETLRPFDY